MRREHLGVLLLLSLLIAAPAGHRARAERAEAVGHMQEAAREYEAAYEQEQAPELLYRLGLARRKLKQYAKAREAFRAYLREAPQGGLREEVTRQLAKLEVLMEAQAEDFSGDGPPPRPAAHGGEQRSPAQREEVNNVHQNAPEVPAAAPPPPAPAPPAPAPAPMIVAAAPPEPVVAAPPAAVAPIAPPAVVPARSRAVPWLAAAAGASAVAGAYFWWDGARLSSALDTRYADGNLVAADKPLFGRAHSASVAGRALAAASLAMTAAVVVLW